MSARSATHGAGDQRQVDVQTRDEEGAAVRHAPMVPHLLGQRGVSDPYEPPARAEVVIDTSVTPLEESVARIRAAMNGAVS